MKGKLEQELIHKIMRLDLKQNLICDNKKSYTMKVINKLKGDVYLIETSLVDEKISDFQKIEIELKGNVDVEYLRYRGQLELEEKENDEGCYYMKINELTKYNMRDYKRVPYKRAISIISPIECEALLVNVSASGALIQLGAQNEIPGDTFTFSILLNKRIINIEAHIIEQRYEEKIDANLIRCKFINLDKKTKDLLVAVVKHIILQAKKRLQEQ